MRHGRSELRGQRGRNHTIQACRLIKRTLSVHARPSSESATYRSASGRGPRSAEFGLSVSLHESRTRSRDCQFRKARTLRIDSRRRRTDLPKTCCGIAAMIRLRHLPRTSAATTPRKKADRERTATGRAIGNYIIEGTKEGLIQDLDVKLKEAAPLEIINGPLMTGMDEVGRLFNNNELIVAEVLQSAEAMKAAVSHLEQFMEKSAEARAGRSHSCNGKRRCPRHRQEPGRHHSVEQRLSGDQPRHQSSAGSLDSRRCESTSRMRSGFRACW